MEAKQLQLTFTPTPEANPVIPMWRHQELKGPVTARELKEAWADATPEDIEQQRIINAAGIASVKAALKASR